MHQCGAAPITPGECGQRGWAGGLLGCVFLLPSPLPLFVPLLSNETGSGRGEEAAPGSASRPLQDPSPFSWVRRGPGGSWRGPRGSPAGAHEGSEWTPGGSGESRCGSGEDPGGVRGGSSGRIGQPRGGGVGYGEPCQAVGTGVRGGAQAPHPLSGTSTGARGSVCSAPPHALPVCPPPQNRSPYPRGTGSEPIEGCGPRRGAPGAPRGPAVPVGKARVRAGARARCPGLEVCTRGGACPRVCAHLPRAHVFGHPHLPREQVRGNAALLRGSGAQRGEELPGPSPGPVPGP